MATINEQERLERGKKVLGVNDFIIPMGKVLTFVKADFDESDDKWNNPPKFFFKDENEKEYKVFIMSFFNEKTDYQNNVVAPKGTATEWVKSFIGRTLGELINEANKKQKRKKWIANITRFRGIDKNGDIRSMSRNGFDFAE